MAGGVQGMAFAAAGALPPAVAAANKENPGGFCWAADVEARSAHFFDQFVELGADSDAEASGLDQFSGGVHFSPHWGMGGDVIMAAAAPGGQHQGFLVPGQVHQNDNNNNSVVSNLSATSRDPRHRQNHLHHHLDRATTSMAGYSVDGDLDGLPHCGSISDSELLKLEGLTMRSPRMRMPQLSASEPASPPSKNHNHHRNNTPRKPAGLLETLCSKIRGKAAAVQDKGAKQGKPSPLLTVPVMSTAQLQPEPAKASAQARPRPQQLSLSKTPLPSPPLTSSGLSHHQTAAVTTTGGSDASFVNGFLDDPFMADGGLLSGGQFVPPLQLNGRTMPQTALQTPLMDGGWQLPMATAAPTVGAKAVWVRPYFAGDNGPSWWDGTATPSGDPMDTDPFPGGPPSYHPIEGRVNLLQLQHHHQQQHFEYPAPPGTDDYPSTLLMHMPQLRGMPPSVLHDPPSTTTTSTTTPRASRARPRPRAPSSGVRHHQYAPGLSPRKGRTATTTASSGSRRCSVSPGPRAAATTGENGRLHRRSASLQTLQSQTTADPTIRKRRSWATARRASSTSSSSTSLRGAYLHAPGGGGSPPPATHPFPAPAGHPFSNPASTHPLFNPPSTHPLSSNPPSTHAPFAPAPQNPPSGRNPSTTTITTTTRTTLPREEDDDLATDGFVNYTPQDHALLMTGVAPSGSSKTKARREREAAERQREFRERLERMVQAVGGDVGVLHV